ncbi:MAG: hypothetical protein Q8Q86_00210, partial [Candidatus Daviesbacteria bacterium]|nr:hypothetical protein [Candidatus Daviesbacteria bacterium]
MERPKNLNFLNKYYNKQDKRTRLLIALFAIGMIIFLLLAATLPFKDKLLSLLYPKPKAQAALSYYGNIINTFGLFGQKDMGSATRQSVTANAAYHGSGVIVDTSSTPNKVYFVDSGNNRILGFNGGDGTAKSADIVIGQPDFFSGNCNGDDNLGYKKAPTAATLCLLPYPVGSNTAEAWGANNIDVDSGGNLYVPDVFNNRILEYYQPFSSDKTGGKGDALADFVYGQPDFTSNGPNGGSTALGMQNPPVLNPPTDSTFSLCCGYGPAVAVGVSVEPLDNGIWVADRGNGRVMHFPRGNKTADVIFGKKGCDIDPNSTINMCAPILGRVNPDSHELYVIDQWNGFYARFMVFKPDLNGRFQTGQAASRIFKPNVPLLAGTNDFMFDSNGYIFKSSGFVFNKDKTDYPTGLIWVNEHERNRSLLLDASGNVLLTLFAKDVYHNGGDSAYSGCPT